LIEILKKVDIFEVIIDFEAIVFVRILGFWDRNGFISGAFEPGKPP